MKPRPPPVKVKESSASLEKESDFPESRNSFLEESKNDISPRRNTFEAHDSSIDLSSERESKIEGERVNFQSFKIVKILGSGTFGKVYKVKNRGHICLLMYFLGAKKR